MLFKCQYLTKPEKIWTLFSPTSKLINPKVKFQEFNFNRPILVKHYSTALNKDASIKKRGEQNKFYFEKSILLDEKNTECTSMYNKIPVVVLLGWSGAQDNQLKKYSQIYSKMGYHTVRFSPSNYFIAFETSKHKNFAVEFLNLIKNEYKLANNPILINNFSNASFIAIYISCVRILNEDSKFREEFDFFMSNRKGMIFDGSVGLNLGFFHLIKMGNIILQGQIKITALRWLTILLVAILNEIYKLATLGNHHIIESLNYYLHKDVQLMPTLHLYTKTDKIVPHEIVSENIEIRRRNFPQQTIVPVLFETGEHVKIYLEHPEKYLELVKEHIKRCGLEIQLK